MALSVRTQGLIAAGSVAGWVLMFLTAPHGLNYFLGQEKPKEPITESAHKDELTVELTPTLTATPVVDKEIHWLEIGTEIGGRNKEGKGN